MDWFKVIYLVSFSIVLITLFNFFLNVDEHKQKESKIILDGVQSLVDKVNSVEKIQSSYHDLLESLTEKVEYLVNENANTKQKSLQQKKSESEISEILDLLKASKDQIKDIYSKLDTLEKSNPEKVGDLVISQMNRFQKESEQKVINAITEVQNNFEDIYDAVDEISENLVQIEDDLFMIEDEIDQLNREHEQQNEEEEEEVEENEKILNPEKNENEEDDDPNLKQNEPENENDEEDENENEDDGFEEQEEDENEIDTENKNEEENNEENEEGFDEQEEENDEENEDDFDQEEDEEEREQDFGDKEENEEEEEEEEEEENQGDFDQEEGEEEENNFKVDTNQVPQKRLVLAQNYADEDYSWAFNLNDDIDVIVYSHIDEDGVVYDENKRGMEATLYLRHILDYYNKLADVTVFIHAERMSWFTEDALSIIESLRWDEIQGYLPLHSFYSKGGFMTITPADKIYTDLKIAWENTFEPYLEYPIPSTIKPTCCSDFIVTRDIIRRNPIQFYLDLYQMTTESEKNAADLLEITWHMIFRQAPVLEPEDFDFCKLVVNCKEVTPELILKHSEPIVMDQDN